jgi:ketosteroid isomerase-like protein
MSEMTVTFEQVIEGIRRAQAAYAQALDDGRVGEIADLFTEDGVTDIEGVGVFEGRDAIRTAYAGWAPKVPQRHIVSNVLVTDWNADVATATSDVVLIQLQEAGWVIYMVARYRDSVRNENGTWLFSNRTTRYASSAETNVLDARR